MSGADADANAQPAEAGSSPAPTVKVPREENPGAQAFNKWKSSEFLTGQHLEILSVSDYLDISTEWWSSAAIEWALHMLRQKFAHISDVHIGTLNDAWALCRKSAGVSDELIENQFRKDVEGKGIIIIPVNDAMVADALTERDKREEPSEKAKRKERNEKAKTDQKTQEEGSKKAKTDPKQQNQNAKIADSNQHHTAWVSVGFHWSFIVIDMRDASKRTARYFDGQVSVDKGKICGYEKNAPIAGRMLCGFDDMLQLEKGKFHARTLKWIPDQRRGGNGRFHGDGGPCGAYLFAFIDHLLENVAETFRGGLEEYFRASRRAQRRRELDFRPFRSRRKVRNELFNERKLQEARGKWENAFNLTPKILKHVLTADMLDVLGGGTPPLGRPSGAARPKQTGGSDLPKTPFQTGLPMDNEQGRILVTGMIQHRKENPSTYGGMSDEEALELYQILQASGLEKNPTTDTPPSLQDLLNHEGAKPSEKRPREDGNELDEPNKKPKT
ncbi:hypothetical protein BU26DRAFT_584649 [Trematosphaeria pertusa]|uniref:Ubiquitin-like protease family profile domain-containing protein n=1 Tax=Trematosphaeria pertusa TaxID=390896 RepID=A0A6A6HXE2_9PLEO|nr:uncharacterized protein BU26DRAFT_584649 [Trematosphaeria pertusa]KAF2242392.1 hypothetical protein BU26DRAFT_584649 [Trematosphaeria pertusa]